jgi:hypothetical protein
LSAAPTAYAGWEQEARALAIGLTGEQPAAFSCRLTSYGGPKPSAIALSAASTSELGSSMLGVPVSLKVGWQVAAWAVAHAWGYHLQTVHFGSWVWTFSTGSWTPTGDVSNAVEVTNAP